MVFFALAQKHAALHIEQAFQASSPKTFQGGSSDPPFFLPLAARYLRSYVPPSCLKETIRMADDESRGRKLQVANARPEDSGRGHAHIPRALMGALGITEGDVVEI